jgi:hypothetical protein
MAFSLSIRSRFDIVDGEAVPLPPSDPFDDQIANIWGGGDPGLENETQWSGGNNSHSGSYDG